MSDLAREKAECFYEPYYFGGSERCERLEDERYRLESKIEDLDQYIYDEDYHGDKAQIVEERGRLADELSDILRELERGYDRDYRLERYPNNPRMWY